MNTLIPPSISNSKAIVPKPSKAEIIEAATQREFEKRRLRYAEEKTRRQNIQSDLKARVLAHVIDNIDRLKHAATMSEGSGYSRSPDGKYHTLYGVRVEFDVTKDIPKKLETDILAYENLPRMSHPDLRAIRAEVRAALAGHQPADKQARINALLSDAKSSKAIDAMLKTVFDKPAAKPAALAC